MDILQIKTLQNGSCPYAPLDEALRYEYRFERYAVRPRISSHVGTGTVYPDKGFCQIWELCLNAARVYTCYNVFTHCYCKQIFVCIIYRPIQ